MDGMGWVENEKKQKGAQTNQRNEKQSKMINIASCQNVVTG